MLTVARTHLVIVAFVLAAGVIAGVRLQLELWETGVRWSAELYNTMIGVHGLLALAVAAPALAGCCGYVMAHGSNAASRAFVPALAWSALAAFVIGVGAAAAAHALPANDGWAAYAPAGTPAVDDLVTPARLSSLASLAFGIAGVLHAVQLGIMLARAARETRTAVLVPHGAFLVGVALASALTAVAAIEPGSIADAHIALATKLAALSLAIAALARRRRGRRHRAARGCLAHGALDHGQPASERASDVIAPHGRTQAQGLNGCSSLPRTGLASRRATASCSSLVSRRT